MTHLNIWYRFSKIIGFRCIFLGAEYGLIKEEISCDSPILNNPTKWLKGAD